jgi:hypothetical protein
LVDRRECAPSFCSEYQWNDGEAALPSHVQKCIANSAGRRQTPSAPPTRSCTGCGRNRRLPTITTPRSAQSDSGRLTGSAKSQGNLACQLSGHTSRRHRLSRPRQHRHWGTLAGPSHIWEIDPRCPIDLGDPHESSFLANFPSSFSVTSCHGAWRAAGSGGARADNVARRTRRGLPDIRQSRASRARPKSR